MLVFIWILSVSGVVVSRHYCGPFLKKVELGHGTQHCCEDMDDADESSGCCSNTTEFRHLEGDFVKVQPHEQAAPELFLLYAIELTTRVISMDEGQIVALWVDNSSGPPLTSSPLFIIHRSIII